MLNAVLRCYLIIINHEIVLIDAYLFDKGVFLLTDEDGHNDLDGFLSVS